MAAAMRFRPGIDITVLGSTSQWFPQDNSGISMPIDYTAIRQPASFLDSIPVSERFTMNGRTVYNKMQVVPEMIVETLEKADMPHESIKTIICHQASYPVLAKIQEGLPDDLAEKMYINVREGNYSSVSIIKALAEQIAQGTINQGDIAVFAGFGAGLYASVSAVKFGE